MRVSEPLPHEALAIALFRVDREYHLQPLNPSAIRLLESGTVFSRAQLSRHSPLDSSLIPLVDAALDQGLSGSDRHFSLPGADGGLLSCSAWASPLEEHTALLAFDSAGDAASHTQSNESAALMAGMLAHEIRNPLLAITGAAQLLKNSSADPTFCDLIARESARIEQLLKELDPLRGSGETPDTLVNIHELLEDAAASVSAGVGPHIRITRNYDPSLPPIRADASRFGRALTNLIKNAAEACVSVAQPEITLATRYHLGRGVRPVAIDIIDNGNGIAPDIAKQLFRPFITTKREGRGLGLPIVARIVEDHGGRVELASGRKGSTRFRIWMPVSRM